MQIIPVLIPYEEDELFYSWLYRLSIYNHSISLNDFANNYLNCGKFTNTKHPRKIKYDFRENVYYFKRALNISDEDFFKVFHDTSIFNAIMPFMNTFNKQLYYQLALKKITENEEYVLLKTLIELTDKIKWCPECRKKELEDKGFFWYHRSHQLPGVKVCHKHECSLKIFTGRYGNEFNDIDNSIDSVQNIEKVDILFSKFCKDFLDSEIDTDIYEIKNILSKKCKELFLHKRSYKELDAYIESVDCSNLFSEKPSLFMNLVEVDGTYLDCHAALPLLFTLFSTVETVKKALDEESKSTKVLTNTFEKDLSHLIERSRFKEILNSQLGSSKEIMEQEIYELVGEEYELVGDYVDRITKVRIKHNKCQHSFTVKPIHFLDGGRCPFCKTMMKEDVFKKFVLKASGELYFVRGRISRNLWVIHDTVLKRDILLTKQKTIQELKRKNQSDILPLNRENDKVPKTVKPMSRDDVLYEWILKRYSENEIIFLEDITTNGYDYTELKHRMKRFRNSNKLSMIAPGIYSFPGAKYTQNDLLMSHYICRNGKHIGFYYGKTLAYELGLGEESDTVHIVSNKESQRHGRKKQIYGFKIRVKGPVTKVTEENYRVLAILDFITSYNTYTKQGKEKVLIAIKDYIKKYRLYEWQIEEYIDLFPVWTKRFIEEVFKEV